MRHPILNFLLLVLRGLSNATPGGIHKSSWVTQTLSKKNLELDPRQGIFDFLVPTLVLVLIKANPIAKEQSYKQGAVGVKAPVVLTWSLHFSRAFLMACKFGITGFNLDCSVRESFIWRSSQEHLNCCAQTGAWRGVFARAKAWCHYCRAEFGIV